MKIRIQKARAENFLLYRQLEMDLDNQGLVFLRASLQGKPGFISNGGGKSSLLSLIPWVLWGEVLRETRDVKRVVSWGETSCQAVVEGDIDGSPFVVTRTRGKKSGVRLDFGGSSRTGDVDDEIEFWFGKMSTAQNNVILGQAKALEFLHARGQNRMKLFEDLLRLGQYRVAQSSVKKDIAYFTNHASTLKAEIDLEESSIMLECEKRSHHNQLARKEIEVKLEGISHELESTIDQEDRLSQEAVKLESQIQSVTCSLDEVKDIREESRSYRNEMKNQFYAAKYKADEVRRRTELAKDGKCPTCGQDFVVDHGSVADELERLEKRMESFTKEVDEAKKSENEAAEKQNQLTVELVRCQQSLKGIEDTIRKLIDKRQELSIQSSELHAILTSTDIRIDDHSDLVQRQVRLNSKKRLLSDINSVFPYLEYWDKGFGVKGIPSRLIAQALPLLNIHTNHVLSEITDGRFRVEVQPSYVGSSGDVIEQLTIVVWDYNRELYLEETSEGEARRIVVSLFLGLGRMQHVLTGSSWNLREIDELLDILDQPGVERVLRILSRLTKEEIPTIILSSHKDEAYNADVFDKVWNVERVGDVSRLIVEGR